MNLWEECTEVKLEFEGKKLSVFVPTRSINSERGHKLTQECVYIRPEGIVVTFTLQSQAYSLSGNEQRLIRWGDILELATKKEGGD